ncbi:hypothetical protein FACS189474_3990 [Bacteroidia bacterium]|nr:hypothetical protein FACS189474_3990 [Bacteroidia bacterium]
MRNIIFNGIILFLLWTSPVYAQDYQETDLGVKISLQTMDVEVQFFNSKTVRVIKSPAGKTVDKESLAVIKTPENVLFDIQQTGKVLSLTSADVRVDLNVENGTVSYFDLNGNRLFAEREAGTVLTPFNDAGNATFTVRQNFLLDAGEAIYGLGQQQDGRMNQRNQILVLTQVNTRIAIPFFQSVKGYGLYWDNYSTTTFSDNSSSTYFNSEVGDCVDYYFMYGKTMDGTVACMRDLTGQAPLFPLWTWGYWQSKERYVSQNELVGTVRKYRDLKVPLDGIVQDWQYWSTNNDYWNGMNFGNPEFPQPQKMADDIHNLNAHTIFSIWPSFGHKTAPFKEFREKGLLMKFPTFPSDSARAYNAYSPEARDIYWKHMDNNLFSIGIDGWWMDATEIEPAQNTTQVYDEQTGLGTFRKVRNTYPLMTTSGVYQHQRAKSSDKRVFILTRSAFAGQQRNGATSWSGDINGDWETFRKQIPAGLNFSACAVPYWNTDIGGFWVQNGGSSAHADYRELYVRWLQFGAFSSMMRSHGANTPREIWQFGNRGDWAFDAIERFIKLRYQLLPYNYSLSWDVTSHSGSVMRMLSMDFPEDAKVHDMGKEYMYGKAFLVAPVLNKFYTTGTKANSVTDFSKIQTYPVYLPQGAAWYDFWTGERLEGGVEIQRETPVDILPLYVKAGSIVPIGEDVQYAEAQNWENLEIRVYPGADAEFTLYEDEKDNYNYESGAYTTIPFTYNENEQSLTIGNRQGNYPGMLTNRTFKIIQVKKGYGMGDLLSIAHDTIVTYSGSEVKIYFDAEKETNYSYYEAEEATLSENLSIHNTNPGFNGTGYVSALEEGNESSITFNVKVKEAGSYLVKLRYSSPGIDNKPPVEVFTNDTYVANLSCNQTDYWSVWKNASMIVYLNAGDNTIRYKIKETAINLDCIYLTLPPNPVPFESSVKTITLLRLNYSREYLQKGEQLTIAEKGENLNNQIWVIEKTGDTNQYKITLSGTNQCLSVQGENEAVVLSEFTGAASQQWQIDDYGYDLHQITSLQSGKSLSVSSGKIVQLPDENPVSQRWFFESPLTPGDGNGLKGEYYSGKQFNTLVLTRIDEQINFNWGLDAPDASLPKDKFTVRWTGKVQPQYTDEYTFIIRSDDGVRLWVNGVRIINDWTERAITETRGKIALEAGKLYDIQLEYLENEYDAIVTLEWECGNLVRQLIPKSQFYADALNGINTPENTATSPLLIYPNPVHETATIRFNTSFLAPIQLEVYDTQGALVKKKTYNPAKQSNTIQLDVNDWPTGLYFIRLTRDKDTQVGKLIKKMSL